MKQPDYDAIVLGAGFAGVSTALHLQRRGKKVALIDRRAPGEETSHGNTGSIEPSSIMPYAFPKPNAFPRILLGRDTSAIVSWADLPWTLPWIARLWFATRPGRRRESAMLIRPLLDASVKDHLDLIKLAGAHALCALTAGSKSGAAKPASTGMRQRLGWPRNSA